MAKGRAMTEAADLFTRFARDAGLEVDPEALSRLLSAARWLGQASSVSGLSQYRDPDDALIRAMGPALAYFSCAETPRTGILADLGAGNGAIGATIAFFAPNLQVDLVDRAKRAYTTSELLLARLGVHNARPVLADLRRIQRRYDVIVFRALAPGRESLQLALSVLKDEGVIGAYHRRGDPAFVRPEMDLSVVGTHETLVPELVLTCYRR